MSKALKARKLEKIKKTQSELIKKQRQQLLQNSTTRDEQSMEANQGAGRAESAERMTTDQVTKFISMVQDVNRTIHTTD